MPNSISPLLTTILLGALIALGTVNHMSKKLGEAKGHQTAHKLIALENTLKCDDDVRITVKRPDGSITCVHIYDHKVGASYNKYVLR